MHVQKSIYVSSFAAECCSISGLSSLITVECENDFGSQIIVHVRLAPSYAVITST